MRLRVLTFNIRTSTGRDGPNSWRWRRRAASEVVRQAELAGLQEARHDQLVDLTADLPGYRWFGRGRADGQSEGEHVPIWWDADRFEVDDQGVFWHSRTPTVPGSRDHERAITRMATWVRLRERSSSVRLLVVNTHFDHRVAEARREAAEQIRQEVDERADDEPVVVLGDLNDRPDAPACRRLVDDGGRVGLVDARTVANSCEGPDSTLHGFEAPRPGAIIDHILVSRHWRVDRYVVDDRRFDGRYPSDHFPVYADLVL